MVQGYTDVVRRLLREHGCDRVRSGKGDHEVRSCPDAVRPVVVDGRILSRHTANAILKQTDIRERF